MSYRGGSRGGRGRDGGGRWPDSGGRGRGGGGNQPSSSSPSPSSYREGGGYEGRDGGGGRRGGGRRGGGGGGGGRGFSSSSAPTQVLTEKIWVEAGMAKLTVAAPPSSSKSLRPPARPGFGTIGEPCVVRANHFLVELGERDLHHYDVSITPEVTSKKLCRDIMTQLAESYKKSYLNNRMPAYDGKKSIYTAGALPFVSKQFVVDLIDKEDNDRSDRKKRQFKVTIKLAAKVNLFHLREFLLGRNSDAPQETIQLLDIVLRAAKPSEDYIGIGRSFFSSSLGIGELGDGLEYWRGYFQSLRPTQMGLSLNIDCSARPFYEPIMVLEFIQKYLNIRQLNRNLSPADHRQARRALKGIIVETNYRGYTRRCKIAGVSSKSMFRLGTGVEISVVQYFLETYHVELKYPFLPCLLVGPENRSTCLPMEVCKICSGQRYARKLNENQVTALLRATCQRPHEREQSIRKMVMDNKYRENQLVKEFGLQVCEALTPVNARVLPTPMLKYHESGQDSRVTPGVGQWNMIGKKMYNGGTVRFWTCLNFSGLTHDLASQFCSDLISICVSKGMGFHSVPLVPIRSVPSTQIEKALRAVHSKAGNQLQLLIIILPDKTISYGTIKRICETELGIISQCCKQRHAVKPSEQYLVNVALKINVKVGGRNTVLEDAIARRIPILSDRPTIIIGADVTHASPGEDSVPSIAAVVASMDWPEVTKYRGLVSAQNPREEIIQDLYKLDHDQQRGMVHGGMIRELLLAFRRSTNLKPDRIIFYRDGVSEGQFSQVLFHEMDAIRKACSSLQEGYLPRVTFVVVQKRHHTRLFATDRNMTDRSGNILPGTVIDAKICHPTEFDFYLCSHAGIQGTSRPTHYHVLHDENNFSADLLQLLTNSLCYTYARCTRSVSIVPPAYYAHLAAFRARYYIEGDASETNSAGSGGQMTQAKNVEVRPLPQIKDNVKEVMFYC